MVPAMHEDEQRRLERFGRLQPPSFSGAEGEDAQGFLDRVPIDRERIRRFIDVLTYQLRLLMTRERVSGATFDEVVSIARQIEMVRGHERVEREAKKPRGQGGFSGTPSRGQFQHAQSSSHASSSQGSSMPGLSASYPVARGSLQSPALAPRCCYECGEFGHMRRECPRLVGGPTPQRSQSMSSASVPPPPAQSARGGAQSARGRPRGGGRSGGVARPVSMPSLPDQILLLQML
ncbi:uncharacterized protein [Nicotiana tomentosiformis]|uniref:uncharacterized protein n=1 Tax=Nicotiana tomentosiformis TaxID=4098 RepID=UPI00388CE1ED